MKWYIVFMLLFNSMYGSILKQEKPQELTAEISLYKEETGEVDLEKIVSAKEKQTIGFKIKEQIIVGVVEKVDVTLGVLRITGSFPNYKNSEFIFEFRKLDDKQVQIIGVLLFRNLYKFYTLEFDKVKKILYFEEKSLDKEVSENKKQ